MSSSGFGHLLAPRIEMRSHFRLNSNTTIGSQKYNRNLLEVEITTIYNKMLTSFVNVRKFVENVINFMAKKIGQYQRTYQSRRASNNINHSQTSDQIN